MVEVRSNGVCEQVELIWCAHKTIEPPLGKLGAMKLRSRLFSLLDRNPVLGETVTGVYMHDVGRDYSQSMAGGDDGLRIPQRAVVLLALSSAPPGGWSATGGTPPLVRYGTQSLWRHMSEAVEGARHAARRLCGGWR